jgi:hypothetical protein
VDPDTTASNLKSTRVSSGRKDRSVPTTGIFIVIFNQMTSAAWIYNYEMRDAIGSFNCFM